MDRGLWGPALSQAVLGSANPGPAAASQQARLALTLPLALCGLQDPVFSTGRQLSPESFPLSRGCHSGGGFLVEARPSLRQSPDPAPAPGPTEQDSQRPRARAGMLPTPGSLGQEGLRVQGLKVSLVSQASAPPHCPKPPYARGKCGGVCGWRSSHFPLGRRMLTFSTPTPAASLSDVTLCAWGGGGCALPQRGFPEMTEGSSGVQGQ